MAESSALLPPNQDNLRPHPNRTFSVDHILAPPWQPMQNGSGDYGPQSHPGGVTTNGHRPTRSLTVTSQSGPSPKPQNGGNSMVSDSPDMDSGRSASRRASDDQDRGDRKSPIDVMGAGSTTSGNDPVVDGHYFSGSLAASFMKRLSVATCSGAEDPGGHTHLQSSHLAPRTASDGSAGRPNRSNPIAMLCEERPSLKLEDFTLPPRPLADHLMSQYWTMCATLYPFLHKPTFCLAYEMLWASDRENSELVTSPGAGLGNATDGGPDTSIFYCALNVMFAIGCQFSDIPIKDRSCAANAFFQRSKQLLRLDILDNGSISLVQTLLLITQYLQCTPYPTRSWNSIGIATRIAQGLGLHRENTKRLPSLDLEVRRRTWYGCATLEM
jgi:Fungal specific transcription factor domain